MTSPASKPSTGNQDTIASTAQIEANERELRQLASKRARLAKFLERVRQGSQYRAVPVTQAPRTTTREPIATWTVRPAPRTTSRPTFRPTFRPTSIPTVRPTRMPSFDTSAKYDLKFCF